jgi:hypothetical protein
MVSKSAFPIHGIYAANAKLKRLVAEPMGVSQDLFRDGFRVAVEAGAQRRAATTAWPLVGYY